LKQDSEDAPPVTAITGAGLANLTGLKHLRKLCLHGSGVTDEGLESLDQFKNLTELDLIETASPTPAWRTSRV